MTKCDDIKYKKRIYISSVNNFNCQISFALSSTRAKLLQTHCSAWYGRQNWQLDTEAVRGFHTEWNNAIRRTLSFPPCTRSKLFPRLAGNQSFTRQVECRWLKFYQCMLTSESEKTPYIGKRSLDNAIVCLGKNGIYIYIYIYTLSSICIIVNKWNQLINHYGVMVYDGSCCILTEVFTLHTVIDIYIYKRGVKKTSVDNEIRYEIISIV